MKGNINPNPSTMHLAESLSAQESFLTDFFRNLESEDINYCIMRGYSGLPQSISHDIDLQVDKKQFKEYLRILYRTAGETGWTVLRRRFRFGRGFNSLVSLNEGTLKKIPIDGEFLTHWKGVQYISNSAVLSTRKMYNGVSVASSGSEAAISLFKEYLQFGKVKDLGDGRHKKRIAMLTREEPENFLAAIEPYLGSKVSNFALACAQKEDWEALESKIGMVRRALIFRAIKRKPVGQIISWYRYLWGHISDRIINPSGIFICLIGPDGSGKTTTSQAMRREMKDAFSDVLYYHGHIGILPELKFFYNLAASFLGRPKRKPEFDENTTLSQAEVIGRLKAVVYMLYYSMDYCLGHFLVRRAKGRGKLVLFDRYFYDYYINGTHRKIPEWLFKFSYFFIPKPDLVIWLKADPEAIYKRKLELSIEQIKWQNRRCLRLTKFLQSAVFVKTDEGPDVALKGCYKAIIARISGRLSKKSIF